MADSSSGPPLIARPTIAWDTPSITEISLRCYKKAHPLSRAAGSIRVRRIGYSLEIRRDPNFLRIKMDVDFEELLRQVTLGQAFDPETIQVMVSAIENAIAQLPLNARSEYTIKLTKSVMDQAAMGERNVQIMQSIALLSIRDVES